MTKYRVYFEEFSKVIVNYRLQYFTKLAQRAKNLNLDVKFHDLNRPIRRRIRKWNLKYVKAFDMAVVAETFPYRFL